MYSVMLIIGTAQVDDSGCCILILALHGKFAPRFERISFSVDKCLDTSAAGHSSGINIRTSRISAEPVESAKLAVQRRDGRDKAV